MLKRWGTILICFLSLGLLALVVKHFPMPQSFEELNQGISYKDILPDTGHTEEFYNESYYHNGWFDDGSVVYIQFIFHNIGIGSFHPSADLTIITPDNKVHHFTEDYPDKNLEIARERFEVKFGEHLLKGDPEKQHYRVRVWFDQLGADLEYFCETPGLLDPGLYYNDNPKDFQRWVTYCLKARVEGQLKVGDKLWKVRGRGFADHAKSQIAYTNLKNGFQLYQRAGNEGISVSLMENRWVENGEKFRLPNLQVALEDKIVFFSRDDYQLDILGLGTSPGGKKFPNKFYLYAKNDWFELEANFEMERFLLEGGLFDRLGKVFGGILAHLFNHPGYYRYLSRFEYKYHFHYQGEEKSGKGKTWTVSQVIYSGSPDFEIWKEK